MARWPVRPGRPGGLGLLAAITARRLSRDEFHAKLAGMDRDALATVLWTLYWRGAAPVRERIEDLLEPQRKQPREQARQEAPDGDATLAAVTEFAALARSGAYLGRDRRVSPKERTRWRMTFRSLARASQQALLGDDVETAARAVSALVDLACEAKDTDYFRSEDPMGPPGSWSPTRWGRCGRGCGTPGALAVWCSSPSRTSCGGSSPTDGPARAGGWVAEREASLASTLTGFLTVQDLWEGAAHAYADALDRVSTRAGGRRGGSRRDLAADLAGWNALLLDRLAGPEHESLVDRLSTHPAFAGPELTFFQAQVARQRGDLPAARTLVRKSLRSLPGHPDFRAFSRDLDLLDAGSVPPRPRDQSENPAR